MVILVFFVAHWFLSLFTQTFFLHRYASHRAFTMSKPWERFFFIFSFFTQGSSYLSPRAYAIMHRMHHAYTDTDKDPHSPKQASNAFLLMWKTRKIYSDIYLEKAPIESRFLKNLPDWRLVDRLGDAWFVRTAWVVFYVLFYMHFATSPWLYILLPFQIVMGPLHGVIINWYAHKYGSVNYQVNNTSRNMSPLGLVMMGENFHNNHHKFPSSINFGVKWYEIDPVYPIIRVFNWLRIIKVNPNGSKRVVTEF
jgi:stearoyl-CoA desaturase (delta-9 desaturase)